MHKTVLISGANGYFGAIACDYFKQRGWRVLRAMRKSEADVFFDLNEPDVFAKKKIDEKIDCFIHAAAAHEVICNEQPYNSIFINVAGTRAALEFCVNNGIPRFIYVSTFHVFGNPQGQIDERKQPQPVNDYGLSHLQAEQYVEMYTNRGEILGTVIRPSNFFGIPNSLSECNRWTLTPLAFCKAAVEEKKIILKTPGNQMRNFIAVQDICATILKLISQSEQYPLLHLTGMEMLSIRDLAFLVKKVMYEKYGEEITVQIPAGIAQHEGFLYESVYLRDIYLPQYTIERFIEDFCNVLMQRKIK